MVNKNPGSWYLNSNIIFNKNSLSKNPYTLDTRIECLNIVEIALSLMETNMYKIARPINLLKVFIALYLTCSLSSIAGIARGCIKRYR